MPTRAPLPTDPPSTAPTPSRGGRRAKSPPAAAKVSELGAALFEAAALPAAVVSAGGRLVQTSASWWELLGLGSRELGKVRWADLTHPNDGHF